MSKREKLKKELKEQAVDEATSWEDEEEARNQKKEVMNLFFLFFPSLLLAIIPNNIMGNWMLPLVIKIFLLFYQFVIIKNFIELR